MQLLSTVNPMSVRVAGKIVWYPRWLVAHGSRFREHGRLDESLQRMRQHMSEPTSEHRSVVVACAMQMNHKMHVREGGV